MCGGRADVLRREMIGYRLETITEILLQVPESSDWPLTEGGEERMWDG